MPDPGNPLAVYWPEPTGFWSEPDGAEITLTGVLPYWRRHISGQGTTYATGVLRLLDGEVPILVPPALYPHVGGLLGEDATLTITGRVDRRGDVHLLAATEVTEPYIPPAPAADAPPALIPWEELTPGRIIHYRHVSRSRQLAGKQMLIRRGRIHEPKPQTKNGSITLIALNKDGSRNKSLGFVTVWRDLDMIVSVEPADTDAGSRP